jgi:hypothetical protein
MILERLSAGPPDEYVGWYQAVADNIAAVLAADGSYFLNIKEHAEDGQRHLYVKKLTIAHVEQWGWRFVDEFCWRKTDNGVPGGWPNRFKKPGSRCFTSAARRRSSSGLRGRACFARTASTTRRTIRSRPPAVACWAPGRAARRRAGWMPTTVMATIQGDCAAEQCDRGEDRIDAGFALGSVPARAGRVLREGVFRRAMWCSIRSWAAGRRWRRRMCTGASGMASRSARRTAM